jgi:hypothetical protein
MTAHGYAAGILPYTFYDGHVYVLLGKDIRDNCWSDFGGKNEVVDDNRPINTAMREFYEETCGIILDIKSLKNRMSQSTFNTQSLTQNGRAYHMYAIEIPYNGTYRSIYRKLLVYMKHIKMFKKRIEKTDIRWVSASNVIEGNLQLRPVFKASFARWWSAYGRRLTGFAKDIGI